MLANFHIALRQTRTQRRSVYHVKPLIELHHTYTYK